MSTNAFIQQLFTQHKKAYTAFPDKELAEQFIDQVFSFLFLPNKKYQKAGDLEKELGLLQSHFSSLVYDVVHKEDRAEAMTAQFFEAIPSLYAKLMKDAEALLKFDPAARSVEEVLVAYPGFYATAVYRLSHQLWEQGVEILPRLFTEYAHSKTGVDIHPGAHIGESFCIDHGTGIVIGETTVIGDNVKIYQGVTLGALQVSKESAVVKRHPTIEDNVTIYSGATILGGQTVIGHDSIIGGNVWLTYSVPSFSVVYHKSEVKVRDKNPFPEPLNFVI
jgi:serine O-acetyltransferase